MTWPEKPKTKNKKERKKTRWACDILLYEKIGKTNEIMSKGQRNHLKETYTNKSITNWLPKIIMTIINMEKAMAPHSSTLAWKIPWTEEPGGLQSMGSHRVGHDWSDLAAAAVSPIYRFISFLFNQRLFSPLKWKKNS